MRSMSAKKLQITVDVDRGVWFRFRELCRVHRLSLNKGVENALLDVLERSGVEVEREVDHVAVNDRRLEKA